MSVKANLAGRRVLVTGASSGIGAAVCRSIVSCGGSVAMLARRKERLDELQAELGHQAVGISCDVTNLEALEAAIDEAAQLFGGLDSVVAVAGRAAVGSIATGSPQGWRQLMDLNLVAPLATVRYALNHFAARGRRDIILIGSVGAITPMTGVGIYAASKRGLRGAFDAMRLELAAEGINSSFVMPGMFDTEGLFGTVDFNGDMPPMDIPMFAPNTGPVTPEALTDTIAYMLGLPEGVCINELVMRPTGQFNP